MNVSVVFEDDSLLVIEKPSGMVVNRADTTGEVETVQDWVESRNSENSEDQKTSESDNLTVRLPDALSIPISLKEEFVSRSGIVHRLDRDTSGLLVIGKTPEAFENLKGQFKSRKVVKKYLALVHGRIEPSSGSINAPIGRNPFNRKHFGVFPGGREAVTDYKLLKYLKLPKSLNDFSFLELTPKTGRTHQIRVHMKYINHPIVSDPIYGGRKNLQADLKFCPRLFLHAASLIIRHPVTGDVREFSSPLPPDLEETLKLLK